jgi:hypothetical protein
MGQSPNKDRWQATRLGAICLGLAACLVILIAAPWVPVHDDREGTVNALDVSFYQGVFPRRPLVARDPFIRIYEQAYLGEEARAQSLRYLLSSLRKHIAIYQAQHAGVPPSGSLIEFTSKTDSSGKVGVGPNFIYGPYFMEIPPNPFTGRATIKVISGPPTAADVTSGGWLYNPATGDLYADHPRYFDE